MDEVWLVLCLGPKDTDEGFINTYTCHLPARVHESSVREAVAQEMYLFTRLLPGLCLSLSPCTTAFHMSLLLEVSLRKLIKFPPPPLCLLFVSFGGVI